MSDWIKENKFAAVLLLVAIVAIIGTYLFAGSKSEAYDAAKEDYDAKSGTYSGLLATEPYPNAANQEAYRKDVVAYRGQVEGLQKSLLAFRPKEFKKISPAQFTTRIIEVGDALKAAYDKSGIKYPDKWQLGFETYTSSPPRDGATDFLDYELNALDWLYRTLGKSGPRELVNVYREKLPVEDGKPMGGGQQDQRGRGRNAAPQEPYFVLPIELTFRGKEASLRTFLGELTKSKEYFFVVRSIRVQNAKTDIPPKKSDAKFASPVVAPAADDLSGFEFVIPGEDGSVDEEEGGEEAVPAEDAVDEPDAPAAPDAPASGELILGQVLGAEDLNVHLQLELILFKANVTLPEVK